MQVLFSAVVIVNEQKLRFFSQFLGTLRCYCFMRPFFFGYPRGRKLKSSGFAVSRSHW